MIPLNKIDISERHDIFLREYVLKYRDKETYNKFIENIEKRSGKKHNKTYKKFISLLESVESGDFNQRHLIDVELLMGKIIKPRDGAHRIAILRHLNLDRDIQTKVVEQHKIIKNRSPGYIVGDYSEYGRGDVFEEIKESCLEFIGDRAKKISKICIVGNSPNVFENECGEFIDSCDYVIRINDFETKKEYNKFVGSKTDIASYSFSPANGNIKEEIIKNNIKNIWCCRLREDKRISIAKTKLPNSFSLKSMVWAEKKVWLKASGVVQEHWRGQPSSGLSTVEMAYFRFPNSKIYLHGFDRDQHKKHYFDSSFIDKGRVGHDWKIEMDYLEGLAKNGKLTFVSDIV